MHQYVEEQVKKYLEDIQQEGLSIKKAVLDAPERAACRRQKQHGGYYSCDVCTENPRHLPYENRRGGNKVIQY